MRGGLDLILGGLLLSTGLLAPGLVPMDDVIDPSNVNGSAWFEVARYVGDGEVRAHEAALEARGPMSITLDADSVVVDRMERREARYVVHNEVGREVLVQGAVGATSGSIDQFQNASIHIEGFEAGELQVWPNASLGPAAFDLELAPRAETPITAAAVGAQFVKDEVYDYQLPGPAFALGHDMEQHGLTSTSAASFEQLSLSGGTTLLLDNATVTITHNGGTEQYSATSGWSQSDPSGHVTVRENELIALSLDATNGTMGFEGVKSTFFAHEPRWMVNGTLRFDASDGHLQAGGSNHSLDDEVLTIEGRTNLSLSAIGGDQQPIPNSIGNIHNQWVSGDRPEIEATFEGDADNVTLAGEPVQVASSAPAIPEEITFWGQVLGLLMLAASVAKKLVGFLAPLVIDNPLDNDRRRRIFEFLKEARMAHRREIHRATGIPNASLEHHLQILCEHNLLVEIKQNGYTVYFPTTGEFTHEDMEKLALLADPTRRSIGELIVQQGEVTQGKIMEEEELSRGQVSRQLSKLSDTSLVRKGDAWPRPYRPSQLLRRWICGETGAGP